ncbi:MAG: DNA-directed RNA polymerase subunit N [Methanobacteriota archaeon]|nr:MAG: DNA-directed RNA polymerase subunit N [Euryarchaeota archaeon]
MEFPVRCFTCGKVLGHLWDKYKEGVASGTDPQEVLNELGLERYCCRRMFVGHVELNEEVLSYIRE